MNFKISVSISETFQYRNTNKNQEEAYQEIVKIWELLQSENRELNLYFSMAFGNPYGEIWKWQDVEFWAKRFAEIGIKNILLSDILQSGGTITYLPADIAIHPNETSGANWDERYLRARGALFRRVFGIKGIGMLLLFFAKHSKTISKKLPLRQALKLTMIAFWDFV